MESHTQEVPEPTRLFGGAIGMDILDVGRLEAALARHPRLRDRIFHAGELELADRHGRPARRLATRFCAKEAALKALGLGGMRLREVEVVGGGGQPPEIRLHGAAAEAARTRGVVLSVSLSHERDVAAAVVLATPSR